MAYLSPLFVWPCYLKLLLFKDYKCRTVLNTQPPFGSCSHSVFLPKPKLSLNRRITVPRNVVCYENRKKLVQTHELIQHAMYLITPLLRIEETFFSTQHIKRESICQWAAQRGGVYHEAWHGNGSGVLHFGYQVSPALFKGDDNASVWGLCAN